MKPLQGVKVVELGTHIAVPLASRLLADWGAQVIKVENPSGDLWRYYGLNVRTPISDEENPMFSIPNANKKIVSLNLKTEAGKRILFQLLEDADVFMTNVRMKGLKGLGLDYESLVRRRHDRKLDPGGHHAVRPGLRLWRCHRGQHGSQRRAGRSGGQPEQRQGLLPDDLTVRHRHVV